MKYIDLPSFGDTDHYLNCGYLCSQAISGNGEVFDACYNRVRPFGAILYMSVPHFISKDPVTIFYIVFMLNIFFFLLALFSVLHLFYKNVESFLELRYILVASVGIVLLAPLLPVALMDMPPMALFVSGLAVLCGGRLSFLRLVATGVLFALAGLLRQNYYVFSFFAFVFYALLTPSVRSWRFLFAFSIGYSPAFLQLVWVWLHGGPFWPYDPAGLLYYSAGYKWPNVELVAYSNPQQSAYLTYVASPQNLDWLSFICLRLFNGVFSFYPAVYLGILPHSRQDIHVDTLLFLKIYGAFFCSLGLVVFSWFLKEKSHRFVLLLSVACIFFTAIHSTVEYRYFLMFKFIILAWLLSYMDAITKSKWGDLWKKMRYWWFKAFNASSHWLRR